MLQRASPGFVSSGGWDAVREKPRTQPGRSIEIQPEFIWDVRRSWRLLGTEWRKTREGYNQEEKENALRTFPRNAHLSLLRIMRYFFQ